MNRNTAKSAMAYASGLGSVMKQDAQKGWNAFEHSWFSTVDALAFLSVAVLFFQLGMNYATLKAKNLERTGRGGPTSIYSNTYQHVKLKTDEPDEEKMTGTDENELAELRSDLEDQRGEAMRLSEEVNRLRQREQSLDAENQILKSKLMQSDPLDANPMNPLSTKAPKLAGPPSASAAASSSYQD